MLCYEHLTSYQLAQCVMSGQYGNVENWGEWTPDEIEQYDMLIAAKAAAREENMAADLTFF